MLPRNDILARKNVKKITSFSLFSYVELIHSQPIECQENNRNFLKITSNRFVPRLGQYDFKMYIPEQEQINKKTNPAKRKIFYLKFLKIFLVVKSLFVH